MARPQNRSRRTGGRRRHRKKISFLTREKIEYVDYKDINLLRKFISDRAKIRARRVTGNNERQQQAVALAIKNAREMALLPYENRVTTQRRVSENSRLGGDRADEELDRRTPNQMMSDRSAEPSMAGPPEVDKAMSTESVASASQPPTSSTQEGSPTVAAEEPIVAEEPTATEEPVVAV